jgi:hypothetical protein
LILSQYQVSGVPDQTEQVKQAKKALEDRKIIGVDAAQGRILDADPMTDRFRISVFVNDEEWHRLVDRNQSGADREAFHPRAVPHENIQDRVWILNLPGRPDAIAWQSDPFAHVHGLAAGFDLFEQARDFANGRNRAWVGEGQRETVWSQNGRFWAWIETKLVEILSTAGVAVPDIRFRDQELKLSFFRVNCFSFDFNRIGMLRNVAPVQMTMVHRVVLVTSGTRSEYLLLEGMIKKNRDELHVAPEDSSEEDPWLYPSQ